VVTPPTPPVALVTTAVFETKEPVVVVEPVKEEPVVVVKEPEVASEEDDTAEIEVVDTHADDLDISTVTSEPEYVNVSVKKDVAPVETPQETVPKEIKEVIPEPVVVKEKVKPASWAGLFAGGTPEPVQEAPKPKKLAPVKKEADSEKAPAASKPTAGPPLTIYLCQLPENVQEAELRTLFEPFGAIKKVDIYALKGFAFVDFADASSVKNAMAKRGSGLFTIRDTAIQVEERQTKGAGMGAKNGSNNRTGRVGGGNTGGNRRTDGLKNGDKKQGDSKGGNNNNRNKTGNIKTTGSVKQAPAAAK
jgi:RNA recognition motif-containing protein